VTAVVVRDQRPEDDDLVHRLLADAFGDEWVGDLARALRARADGGAALVAVLDEVPVGHVQLSRGWVDAPQRLVDVSILSPLGVAPAMQRRGVGAELVRAALSRATDLGIPLVFLEGSPDYYPRFGFAPARPRGFETPSDRIPDAGFQVATTSSWEPWMVGRLVYNDTFWKYDCVGLRPQSSIVSPRST
jgi:putative acetyltransferase